MWLIFRWALVLVLVAWFLSDPAGFGDAVGEAASALGDAAQGAFDGK